MKKFLKIICLVLAPLCLFADSDIRKLKELAESGDSKAILNFAEALYGLGNIQEAILWGEKAASQKYQPAQAKLALWYAKSSENNIDQAKALEYYKLAASQNHPEAQFELGEYLRHHGDMQNAFIAIQKAAKQDYAPAQFQLALMYGMGEGAMKSLPLAFAWCQKSADQNFVQAQALLGAMYEQGQGCEANVKKAVEYYELAAEENNPDAQYRLGELFFKGAGVKQSLPKAFFLFSKSAEQEYPQACFRLGQMYFDGIATEKNVAKGIELFKLAAKHENVDAQRKLIDIYVKGDGVKPDPNQVFSLVYRLSMQGHKEYLFDLAMMYHDGYGTSADIRKALYWFMCSERFYPRDKILTYEQFMDEKNPPDTDELVQIYTTLAYRNIGTSQFILALIYENLELLPTAYAWYLQALSNNIPLAKLKVEEMEKRLSQAQQKEGRKLWSDISSKINETKRKK